MNRPGKILIAEIATDEYDRGAQSLAAGLRDGGFEVVYTGAAGDAHQLAREALDEDVDVLVLYGPAPVKAPTMELAAALRGCGMGHARILLAGGLDGAADRRLDGDATPRQALDAVRALVTAARRGKTAGASRGTS